MHLWMVCPTTGTWGMGGAMWGPVATTLPYPQGTLTDADRHISPPRPLPFWSSNIHRYHTHIQYCAVLWSRGMTMPHPLGVIWCALPPPMPVTIPMYRWWGIALTIQRKTWVSYTILGDPTFKPPHIPSCVQAWRQVEIIMWTSMRNPS